MTNNPTILSFAQVSGLQYRGGAQSNTNLDEWDAIYWPQSHLFNLSGMNPQVAGTYNSRIKIIRDWLEVGRTLIITLEVQGYNRLYLGELGVTLALQTAEGNSVKVVGDDAVIKLLDKYAGAMRYNYVFSPDKATTFAAMDVVHTKKPTTIGAVFQLGKGAIVIAPPLVQGISADYIEALAGVPQIMKLAAKVPEPSWLSDFRTKIEVGAWVLIGEYDRQIAALKSKRDTSAETITSEGPLKRLLWATGTELQEAVANGLKELGFEVVSLPGRRTDILARHDNRLLAVEVKGPENRTAKAEDMGQAIRWRSDVTTALVASDETIGEEPHLKEINSAFAKLGVVRSDPTTFSCKAMLLIETFRSRPLDERNSLPFEADLNSELKRFDVCALTGTQLLGLLLEARDGRDKHEIRDLLFSTMGQLKTPGWDSFLTVRKLQIEGSQNDH